jgi:polyphosphate glucokinase
LCLASGDDRSPCSIEREPPHRFLEDVSPYTRAVTRPDILAIDVGGSKVKLLVSRPGAEPRRFASGKSLSAARMVDQVRALASDWGYEVVSIGVPAPVHGGLIVSDPFNLGRGWIAFDFEGAFGKPTKLINDAAMQALGSYEGGKMLFLGLGTGLGAALVVDGIVEPMELAHLPFRKQTFEDYVGERGLERLGRRKWRLAVLEVIERFSVALEPDYVVLGGGNAKKVGDLPAGTRLGANGNAFIGGFRLWDPAASAASVAFPEPPSDEAAGREVSAVKL